MIVTIDGPGGVGKSSLSKKLAEFFNFSVLDTGAMYRAVAFYALEQGAETLEGKLGDLEISVENGRCLLNGRDISAEIRSPEIDLAASRISVLPSVRAKMQELQRAFALGRNLVAEGRDMGSQVFPGAEVKIYLDASPGERALRRQRQLKGRGVDEPLQKILSEMEERDERDRSRASSPLRVPPGACVISTDGRSLEEVFALLVEIVENHPEGKSIRP